MSANKNGRDQADTLTLYPASSLPFCSLYERNGRMRLPVRRCESKEAYNRLRFNTSESSCHFSTALSVTILPRPLPPPSI